MKKETTILEHIRANDRNSCALSVIIPFYADPASPYLLPRLDGLCRHFPLRDDIEFIVVDSGSPPKSRKRCQAICRRHNVRYLYHDREGQIFAPGLARNYGTQHAKGRAACFFEVDLRVAADFWSRLLDLMGVMEITKIKKSLLGTPCLYLSQQGSEQFAAAEQKSRFQEFYMKWLHQQHGGAITLSSYCSSLLVVDRLHYLSIGGNRPFYGHGCEDYELYHRLIGEEGVLPMPNNYYKGSKILTDLNSEVFISRLNLNGEPLLMSNLFALHLWHPRESGYYRASKEIKNTIISIKLFKEFDRTGEHPPPLIDAEMKDRVLFVGDEGTNAISCLRDVIPLLGETVCADEKELTDGDLPGEKFQSFLKKNRIDAVLFHNPNANPARRRLYEWCRDKKLKTISLSKGLLPDSWFFDDNGYGADSKSYAKTNWNKPLSAKKKKQIADYVKNTLPKPPLKKIKNFCAEIIGRPVSAETLYRFIYFLRYEFYSFAENRKTKTKMETKSTLPWLDFYEIRLPSKSHYVYSALSRLPIPMTAPLFERFRANLTNKRRIIPIDMFLILSKWIMEIMLSMKVSRKLMSLRRRLRGDTSKIINEI